MNDSLTVYTLPGCMQCDLTTRVLDDAGLPYIVVDLATDAGALDAVKQLGYSSAPVVVVGAASWSGFRPDRIKTVAMAPATVPASSTDELGCDSWE
ncbi:glutaredoxin family protein [Cryobacterium sp. TMB3-1-2]|uniref:glutaredoxin family protein n=1 Tax=Cryobacterium sp. TMB3-1-2 TaxID=1259208 RepID=UPI00351A0B45